MPNSSYQMIVLSVVLPVFNNSETVSNICVEICEVCKKLGKDRGFLELVLVNDGSEDGSLDVLREIKESMGGNCKLINLTRNFGQLNALLAGYRGASGSAIVSMSADGQDPPKLIEKFFQEWEDGEKLVVGCRESRNDGFVKNRTSEFAWRLLRKFAVPNIPLGGFDYFLMDRELCDYYIRDPEQFLFMQGRLLFYGIKPCCVPYARAKRRKGRSQTSSGRRLQYFADGFTSYSLFPLRCITVLGILAFCVSLLLIIAIIVSYLFFGTKVEGWASLAVIILLMSGVQTFCIGVLGEYLSRINQQTTKRPHYVIKDEE